MPATKSGGLDGFDFVSVRRAGRLLGGKAPGTVKNLVIEKQLEAKHVQTEAGHKRMVISTQSIRRHLEQEAAKAAAERDAVAAPRAA